MAIKIEKHKARLFRTTCDACGCVFTYEPEDIEDRFSYLIDCPECGESTVHRAQNAVKDNEYCDSCKYRDYDEERIPCLECRYRYTSRYVEAKHG